jgi:NADPH-dependent 7-cyano-7-deazaguanine reductase QueF
MKKKVRIVKHFCHNNENDSHERCLIKIYNRYFELVNKLRLNVKANPFSSF